MPWDATPGGGFTTGKPWFRFGPGHEVVNVAAQTTDPASLLSHYRKLIRVRHGSKALTRGNLELIKSAGPLLAFLRTDGTERVLVVHNLGSGPLATSLPVASRGAQQLLLTEGASLAVVAGTASATLPPHASAIVRLE
jgi:glycosidase